MVPVSLSQAQRLGANSLSVRLNNIDVCVYILEKSYVFRNLDKIHADVSCAVSTQAPWQDGFRGAQRYACGLYTFLRHDGI